MLRRIINSRLVLWGAPFAWMAVIYILSDQPSLPQFSARFDFQDVAGHLLVYAVLAILWRRALAAAGVRRAGWWAFAIALFYGFTDEYHQGFVPNRVPDPFDIATDAVGAAAGLAITALFRGGKGRPKRL